MKQFVLAVLLVLLAMPLSAQTGVVQKIDKKELRNMLDAPELVLFDVRAGSDWSASDKKITGARRLGPEGIVSETRVLPRDRTIVLYCA